MSQASDGPDTPQRNWNNRCGFDVAKRDAK